VRWVSCFNVEPHASESFLTRTSLQALLH
jgi:hypothetical protein